MPPKKINQKTEEKSKQEKSLPKKEKVEEVVEESSKVIKSRSKQFSEGSTNKT